VGSSAPIVVLVLLVIPGLSPTGTGPSGTPTLDLTCSPTCVASTNLTVVGGGTAVPAGFWGTTASPRSSFLPSEAETLRATPTQTIVWPGGDAGDDYDPIDNWVWHAPRVAKDGGGYYVHTPVLESEADFVQLCVAIQCTAIVELPAEIDNATVAGEVVNYTVHTLGFQPAFWEVGNEPGLWTHFDEPWTEWHTGDSSYASPSEYAAVVAAYIAVLQADGATGKVIGLSGGGSPLDHTPFEEWVTDVVERNGPELAGIAFHEYPVNQEPASGKATLSEFYTPIQARGPFSVPTREREIKNWIVAAETNVSCTRTCSIPIFLTEIGSGLSGLKAYAAMEAGFPGALSLAAQMTEALNVSIENVDLFESVLNTHNSWFAADGTPRPDYTLWTTILNRLGTVRYGVDVNTPGVPGLSSWVYGIETRAPSSDNRSDLLVVNTNLSYALRFSVPGANFTDEPTEVWSWSNTSLAPLPHFFPEGIPGTYSLPPNSLALFEAYPGISAPVQFRTASPSEGPGFPKGSPWFVQIAGSLYYSNETNLTVLLPPGTYAPVSPTLPVIEDEVSGTTGKTYQANLTRENIERVQPFVPPPFILGAGYREESILFVHQWATDISASAGGAVEPDPSWWNASEPLTLSALSFDGFQFGHWYGQGAGSQNATTGNESTITPTGRVVERAIFDELFPVNFTESGLPNGTNWSVTLRGVNATSASPSLAFSEINSTYAFRVANVTGYRPVPDAGSVPVRGSGANLTITFVKLTPPAPRYPVTFNETGLPVGTEWSVTVRGAEYSSDSATIVLPAPNGTWGFKIGNETGYRAYPPAGSFLASGGGNVTVAFRALTPPAPRYPVLFLETGLPAGTNWSVTVGGVAYSALVPEITLPAPNGTWGFTVGPQSGFRAYPPAGSFNVSGGGNMTVAFRPTTPPAPRYPTTFLELGLPSGTNWSLLVRGVLNWSTSDSIGFLEPNGTWGFYVLAPLGYRAVPVAGSYNVSGGGSMTVRFTAYTPPEPRYGVQFVERGLPTGTAWSVNVLNSSATTTNDWMYFEVPNGTHGYFVYGELNYVVWNQTSKFVVAGAPVTVVVDFLPARTVWNVTWVATGLWQGVDWWVTVGGTTLNGTSAWKSVPLANGTYLFTAGDAAGFAPTPRVGVVVVTGGVVLLNVSFVRPLFPVEFAAFGLPPGLEWTFRLASELVLVAGSTASLPEPNGSYSYNVVAPPQYGASPSRGNLSVEGGRAAVSVVFTYKGPAPVPSIWSVGVRAITVGTAIGLAGLAGYAIPRRLRGSRRPVP
jgi:hypothetical protein